MKHPNHILLDIYSTKYLNWTTLWVKNYKTSFLTLYSPIFFLFRINNHTRLVEKTIPGITIYKNNITRLTNNNLVVPSSITKLNNLFNLHFLRKERLYTKLKYSRCPQYDIVSGGIAAILAGFIGFLVAEKFGIELIDSGDFYIAVMYLVIAGFSLRPLIKTLNEQSLYLNLFSFSWFFLFYINIIKMVFYFFKALKDFTLYYITPTKWVL